MSSYPVGTLSSATPHTWKPRATMQDTLRAMRDVAIRGRRDLNIRGLSERIVADVAQGDYSSEVLAIYYWVCRNIRYVRDPDGVEMVKEPAQVLRTRSGDCDDIAVLLAAMLMSIGNSVQFAIASFAPGAPVWSHVYIEVLTPSGVIAIDPVANRDTPKMLRQMRHKRAIPISGTVGRGDAGIGRPARHMGARGGRLYSVWDYHRGVYDYFEGPAGAIPATGSYRAPRSRTSFGATPEAIAAPLPAGAKKVGSGEQPRGMIASRSGGSGGGSFTVNVTLTGVLVGIGIGWWMWKRRRR